MKNALTYLDSLGLYNVKPGLERITELLSLLGNPEENIKKIIVAGTNGKGSVAGVVSSVLAASGYKTGLYSSPPLNRITERIKVNGKEIPTAQLSEIILKIKDVSSKLMTEEQSYFEALTAASFLYFSELKVDFGVVEVGMGGRWDATNVSTPLVSVITNVSKDHTEFLGERIEKIAYEKTGVIKEGIPVVTAARGEALKIIREAAKKKSSPLMIFDRDFLIRGNSPEEFSYTGRYWNFKGLHSNLQGLFQLENLAVAISTLEILSVFHDVKINESELREGISSVICEGRMEVIRESPPLILDGAHNPAAGLALKESLSAAFPGRKFLFLVGMLRDKDAQGFFAAISQIAQGTIVTSVPSERDAGVQELGEIAGKYAVNVEINPDYKLAFENLKKIGQPACVTGSLYLVGGVKALLP